MKVKGNSPVLAAIGLVVAAVAAVGVVVGRTRGVEIPWECFPEAQHVIACDRPGPNGERMDRVEFSRGLQYVTDHKFDLSLLPASAPCTPGPGVIDFVVDPTLDDQRIAVDGPQPLPDRLEDPYDGALPLSPVKWGTTELRCGANGEWLGASTRLHPRAGALAVAHEAVHGLSGVPDHDRFHPPTGHLMHEHDPSLDDWRGVEPPKSEKAKAKAKGGK